MPKIILEKPQCIGCGTCAALCSQFFEMEETKSHLKNSQPVGDNEELEIEKIGCAKEAADNCPVQIIKIENS